MVKSESPEIDTFDDMHSLKEEQNHLTNSSIKGTHVLPINDESSEIDIFDEMHFLKEEQNHLTNPSIKGSSDLSKNEYHTLKIPLIKLSKLYWCNKCKRKFETAKILKAHTEEHDLIEKSLILQPGSTKRPYTCLTCKQVYMSFLGLKKHIMVKHKSLNQFQQKTFDCDICQRKFRFRLSLERHRLSDSKCSNHYKCPSCVKGFLTTEALEKHIRGNCLDQSSEYNIARTKHIISTELFKQQRENCQTAGSVDLYFCDICLKFFLKKAYLDAHQKLHSTNKSSVCKVCGKIFRDRPVPKRHQKNLTEENPYFECEFCKLKFCSRMALVLHYKTHLYNSQKITSKNAPLKAHDFQKDDLKTCESNEIVAASELKSENQDEEDGSLVQEQRKLGKLTESEKSFLFPPVKEETFDADLNNEIETCDVKIELEE